MMLNLPSVRLLLTLMAGLTIEQALLLPSGLVLAQSGDRAITIAQPNKSSRVESSQRRVALVIGNGEYQAGTPLRNPPNDAADVAAAFRDLGFSEVIVETNADLRRMDAAVDRFSQALGEGSVGVFYYAGHGIQSEGENYLIPVDATIDAEQDLRYEALPLGKVLGRMEDAGNEINIVILDACRNNPFARAWRSAGNSGGLATIDVTEGALIAYATGPGNVAADGDGRNGTFTAALLEHLREPGLDVELMLKRVRGTVKTKTAERQIPWTSSSLVGDFSFNPAEPGSIPVDRPVVTALATAPRSTGSLGTAPAVKPTLEVETLAMPPATASRGGDETIPITTLTRRGDRYSLPGRAGQQVEISVTSEDFDTYLIVQNDRGESIAEDDDSGDGNNASLSLTLPRNETYQVIVSSYDEASTGAYELQMDGVRQSGALSADTPLLETLYVKQGDRYGFQGRAGETVQIRLESEDFDPYVMVQNAAGETIAENDDSNGSYNSLLTLVLPETGTYDAIATSYAPEIAGRYSLQVNQTELVNPPLLQPSSSRLDLGDRVIARTLTKQGDRYRIQGQANQMVEISLESPDFDTYLILQNDRGEVIGESDDSENGTNSILYVTFPETGIYTVTATAFAEGSTGNYQLRATETQINYTTLLPEQLGDLATTDPLVSSQYVRQADEYFFSGEAGQKVEIQMESPDFDTYLILQNEQGETIAENDDHQGSNSLLNVVLPQTGSYRVIARAYAEDTMGAYTLAANELQLVPSPLVQEVATLDLRDPIIPVPDSTRRGDAYTFRGTAGQRLEISLTSDDFDTYLILQNEQGETIAENDDSQGSNSTLHTTLPATGTYTILATGYAEDSQGTYQLNAQEAQVVQALIPTTQNELEETERLVTQTIERQGDRYTIQGKAGQEIEVRMSSELFDTYLVLQNEQGEVVAENDDGEASNSILNATLPVTGTYTIVATAYGSDAMGTYQLQADNLARQERSILPVTPGQLTAQDELTVIQYSRQGDRHTFSGKAGQNVLINLESDEFDPYLILQNEAGETIAENDDNGEGQNSTVRMILPDNGTYQVLATSFNEESTGAYRLKVQEEKLITPAIVEVVEGQLGD